MPPRIVLSFEGEFIPVDTFTAAIDDLAEILYEIDKDISGTETLDWGISSLKGKDTKSIVAVPRLAVDDKKDQSNIIVPTFLRGLKKIRQKPERPAHFTDDALYRTKELSRAINGNIHKISVTGSTNGRLQRPVIITPKVAANIDTVIGPRYTSFGAIEGRLEMISIRRFSRFGITHSLTGRSIKCRFQRELLDEVKAALGKRVVATGIVHYNAQGDPIRVDVEWLRLLREGKELPSSAEIGGSDPDFTGDLSTAEYLRNLRG